MSFGHYIGSKGWKITFEEIIAKKLLLKRGYRTAFMLYWENIVQKSMIECTAGWAL
jgi:hypothetical protein